jgi:hypothetical protein
MLGHEGMKKYCERFVGKDLDVKAQSMYYPGNDKERKMKTWNTSFDS